jgi:dienelactone hydrolase
MKKLLHLLLAAICALAGCGRQASPLPRTVSLPQPQAQSGAARSLREARQGFQTKLVSRSSEKKPVPQPPPQLFHTVHYVAAPGKLAAYLTPDLKDGKKHPAIIWITGGDCNTIWDVWSPAPANNDQTATAYRKAGIVMMFPSLRGGNDNPGMKEGFLGEVDDILAAADFLGKQPYVDPGRIYLGGHSSGGTLVLLVAECSDRFRAIFSFGPVDSIAGYSTYPELLPFDLSDPLELEPRSPGRWLASIKTPTFVFEGTAGDIRALQAMARSSTNPKVHFIAIRGADHFSVLAPTNRLIADKILRDDGQVCTLSFTPEEASKPFAK